MKSKGKSWALDRRAFLAAGGGSLLAAGLPAAAKTPNARMPGNGAASASAAGASQAGSSSMRKIPIGVFDPVYDKLSLDEMLERVSALGLEAMEIGVGGYPGSGHCPVDELLADPSKVKAWKKKFEDHRIHVATLSCHGNPVHPDAKHAARDQENFKKAVRLAERLDVKVIVGFSGCPGGSPSETQPNWITYRWPPEYAEMQDWQWKEKVIPYWRDPAKLAAEQRVTLPALAIH